MFSEFMSLVGSIFKYWRLCRKKIGWKILSWLEIAISVQLQEENGWNESFIQYFCLEKRKKLIIILFD